MKEAADSTTTDYRVRRGEISAYGRATNSSIVLRRLALAMAALVVAIVVLTLMFAQTNQSLVLQFALFVLGLCSVSGIGFTWLYARKNFIEPDLAFRKWLQQVCDGNLDARIELPESHKHYKELNFHTRNLATALNRLSTEMETLVESQTERLEYQNKCLDLLFNLATDISGETSRRSVLDTVCRYLADWYPAAVVSAYLAEGDETQRIAIRHTRGATPTVQSSLLPRETAPMSVATLASPPLVECLTYDKQPEKTLPHRIRVPIFNNEIVVGMIVIETDKDHSSEAFDAHRVLATIGEQLNLFTEKRSMIEQTRITQMVRDRSALAAEIHDSLAQTLAALRYQVTLLGESMQSSKATPELCAEVQRIQGTVGEANQEVRGLISEFRQPLAKQRFADSIRSSVEAFGERIGLQVYFQSNDPRISFTPREESQLQRIIGEALTNAQKYAQCSMVRVYMRWEPSGVRRILIEDDGVGFSSKPEAVTSSPSADGNHIGLAIMQDRASSIGARLFIESEQGEGTRIIIELPPQRKFDGATT